MPPTNQSKTKPSTTIEKTRQEPATFPPQAGPPRGVLQANEARGGAFFHQRLAPPPELAAWVQHYWYVQWDLRNAPPSTAETLPHPSCYLIFEHDLDVEAQEVVPESVGQTKTARACSPGRLDRKCKRNHSLRAEV